MSLLFYPAEQDSFLHQLEPASFFKDDKPRNITQFIQSQISMIHPSLPWNSLSGPIVIVGFIGSSERLVNKIIGTPIFKVSSFPYFFIIRMGDILFSIS